MQIKKIGLTLAACCLGISFSAPAQGTKILSYQLRCSPLALIDPHTPVLQLGTQATYKRLGFSAEFGMPFDVLARLGGERTDSLFVHEHYYKVRAEAKYFLAPGAVTRLHPYLSVEGFWVPRSFRRYNDLLETTAGTYRFAYSNMSRNVLGGCIKIGLEPVIYKRWVLDMFWGLGIRHVAVTHRAEGLKPAHQGWIPAFFYGNRADRREGTFCRPHLAVGFKVGFVLR